MRPEDYPYSYAGRKPCGCMVAVCIDMSKAGPRDKKQTARYVSEMIARGLTVERVTHDVVREQFIADWNCPHKPVKAEARQKSLFGEVG